MKILAISWASHTSVNRSIFRNLAEKNDIEISVVIPDTINIDGILTPCDSACEIEIKIIPLKVSSPHSRSNFYYGIWDVINQIKIENPHLWDEEMKNEAAQMILEGTELEIQYARDTMPRGVLGMNASMMEEYLQFIANRRLTQIGLDEEFKGATNPFPWMSEIMDLRKEKNFFETRVIEYQTGGALNWE